VFIYLHTHVHRFMYMSRTRQLNIGSFVGVIVQHRQLKTSSLKQREDSGREFCF
jgi:hypothetical protein